LRLRPNDFASEEFHISKLHICFMFPAFLSPQTIKKLSLYRVVFSTFLEKR
jgi:hypothetical protein